jgi:uncharacterized membrane protein YbhN (UPF0104 family)
MGRAARWAVGMAVLGVAVGYLVSLAEDGAAGAAGEVARVVAAEPLTVLAVLGCYATAFGLRSWAWTAVLPGLPAGQAWAALHVSLLGNHVLPLRLGEVLRVTSVLRRTQLPTRPVAASAVALRLADLLAVLALALAAAPGILIGLAGPWLWLVAVALLGGFGGAVAWWAWVARARLAPGTPTPPVLAAVAAATGAAWLLEAAVVWGVARIAGATLTPAEAVAVTAVTIAAQSVAITPGGIGSYEAAATAALAAIGVSPTLGFGIALTTHAVKTAYSLVAGATAFLVPTPSYWGRFRLPRSLPARPASPPAPPEAPVVVIIPAYDEEATVGVVVADLPPTVAGRPVVTLVIDDGSTDATADVAAAAGATVVGQPANLGLGAAVRRGLAEATAREPAAVVYLDADGEYYPSDLPQVAQPILDGTADYVVGSRFAGRIHHMRPQRRLGNRVLTSWLRWLARRPDITDGQSGYRAFSARAAADAEIVHDYNYAQVLTLDLLGKGYAYAEAPIQYAFRRQGTSFVRLGRYLRRVVPAVHRELNRPAAEVPQPRPQRAPAGSASAIAGGSALRRLVISGSNPSRTSRRSR